MPISMMTGHVLRFSLLLDGNLFVLVLQEENAAGVQASRAADPGQHRRDVKVCRSRQSPSCRDIIVPILDPPDPIYLYVHKT